MKSIRSIEKTIKGASHHQRGKAKKKLVVGLSFSLSSVNHRYFHHASIFNLPQCVCVCVCVFVYVCFYFSIFKDSFLQDSEGQYFTLTNEAIWSMDRTPYTAQFKFSYFNSKIKISKFPLLLKKKILN